MSASPAWVKGGVLCHHSHTTATTPAPMIARMTLGITGRDALPSGSGPVVRVAAVAMGPEGCWPGIIRPGGSGPVVRAAAMGPEAYWPGIVRPGMARPGMAATAFLPQ